MVTLFFVLSLLSASCRPAAGWGARRGNLGILAEANGDGTVVGTPRRVGAVVEVVVCGFVVVEDIVNARA